MYFGLLAEHVALLESKGSKILIINRLKAIKNRDIIEVRHLFSRCKKSGGDAPFVDEEDVRRTVDGIVDQVMRDTCLDKPDLTKNRAEHGESVERKGENLPKDWKLRRKKAWIRDGHACQRCGVKLPLTQVHIHHVRSRKNGGSHKLSNLVTLCITCHNNMPEHNLMPRPVYYAVDRNKGVIHTASCSSVREAKAVYGSYSKAQKHGYSDCHICKPQQLRKKKAKKKLKRVSSLYYRKRSSHQ